MEQSELAASATNWIRYWQAPKGSPEWLRHGAATEAYDCLLDDPERLWLLILEIHRQDQSDIVQGRLAAGFVEDLLGEHGEAFIDRIEALARKDPQFAKVLSGVWGDDISEAVWRRVQAVWERRGWDGIPE